MSDIQVELRYTLSWIKEIRKINLNLIIEFFYFFFFSLFFLIQYWEKSMYFLYFNFSINKKWETKNAKYIYLIILLFLYED